MFTFNRGGGGGDMAKISYHNYIYYYYFFKYHDFITFFCHVGFIILQIAWVLQPNLFPYYKDKAFQGNRI